MVDALVNADERSVEILVVQQKVNKMSGGNVSDAVRDEAVRRIVEDGVAKELIAKELSIALTTVKKWLRDYNMIVDLKEEIERLKGNVERLKKERDECADKCMHLESKLEGQREFLFGLFRDR